MNLTVGDHNGNVETHAQGRAIHDPQAETARPSNDLPRTGPRSWPIA